MRNVVRAGRRNGKNLYNKTGSILWLFSQKSRLKKEIITKRKETAKAEAAKAHKKERSTKK